MNESRLLADAVLVLHLGFVLFVVFGGLLVLRWHRVGWAHLPAAAWGAWIELTHGVCPLTPLENALRRAAGEAGHAGGFIEHSLAPLIYPVALEPGHQTVLGVGVIVLNLGVYAVVLRRRSVRI